MEPENTNQTPVTFVKPEPIQPEPPKPQVEEPPVIVDWKKPLISMIIVSVVALGLMLVVKYL
jgi:uncharacterized RDD family membrane protein YckC